MEETIPDDLKDRINTLPWCTLPSGATLQEAERIAVQVFDLIRAAWATRGEDRR